MKFIYILIISVCISLPVVAQDSLNVQIDTTLFTNPPPAFDLVLVDTFAYVAFNQNSFYIYNVADPTNPVRLNTFDTGGVCRKFFISGDLIISLGDHQFDFRIFDISDRMNPDRFDSIEIDGDLTTAMIFDRYVFCTGWQAGLHVIDISDPGNIRDIQEIDIANRIYDIDLDTDQNFLILSAYWDGFDVVDISNPEEIVLIESIETEHRMLQTCVTEDYLFVGCSRDDIHTFEKVYEDGGLTLNHIAEVHCDTDDILDMSLLGDYLYITHADGVGIADISNPTDVEFLGNTNDIGYEATCIELNDTLAIVGYNGGGLHLFNTETPEAPQHIGEVFAGQTQGMRVKDQQAWFIHENEHLQVFDLTNLPQIDSLNYIDMDDRIESFQKLDTLLIVGTSNRLHFFDCTDINNIEFISDYRTGSTTIATKENYLYGLDSNHNENHFEVLDISDPTSPEHLTDIELDDEVMSLEVQDSLLYVLTDRRLFIFDVRDPSNPIQLERYHTPGHPKDIEVNGTIAYLSDYEEGTLIFDISNTASIIQIGELPHNSTSFKIDSRGNILAESRSDGVYFYNCTNPEQPYLVGYYSGIEVPVDIEFYGTQLWYEEQHNTYIFNASRFFPNAEIELSDNSINFGTVAVGEIGSASLQIQAAHEGDFIIDSLKIPEGINLSCSGTYPRTINSNTLGRLGFIWQPVNYMEIEASEPAPALRIYHNAENYPSPLIIPVRGQSSYFRPVPPNGLPWNIVVNEVQIDENSIDSLSQVAVYDGDLCVGAAMYIGEYPFQVTVWENTGDPELQGFTRGNPMSFRIFSMADEAVFDADFELIEGSYEFGMAPYSEVSLNAWRGIDIPLSPNRIELISFQYIPEDLSAATIFQGIEGLRIVLDAEGGIYLPDGINTIGDINLTMPYRVVTTGIDTLTIQGFPLGFNQEYFMYPDRVNWLGHPYHYPVSVQDALSTIDSSIIVMLDDSGRFWVPNYHADIEHTLTTLLPGDGYYVVTADSLQLTYPEILYRQPPQTEPEHTMMQDFATTGSPFTLPWILLVQMDADLISRGVATVVVYDGNQPVGSVQVQEDKLSGRQVSPTAANGISQSQDKIVPIICWQKHDDANFGYGSTSRNSIGIEVLDVNEMPIPVNYGELIFNSSMFGEVRLTAVESQQPEMFSIEHIYPNPFNSSLAVSFNLPNQGLVNFSLTNILGQTKYEVLHEFEKGKHRFVLDLDEHIDGLGSGMYFLRIRSEEHMTTRKVVLIR
ncbi:T9SS type A sorting domain-containing protein [bacterium]|nr:T9SS type A sorting domain-containing protein [bacterium]